MQTTSALIWKIRLVVGSVVIIFVAVCLVSYRATTVSRDSYRWVRHTHEVLENLQDSLFAIQTIESSYRGFILTGSDDYLNSFHAGVLRVQMDGAILRKLTVDNAAQQRRLPTLDSLVTQKVEFGEMVIGLRQTQGLEAAAEAMRRASGQPAIDEFQQVVREMQDEELRLLALRDADAERHSRQSKAAIILGGASGLLIAALAGWISQSDLAARRRAEAKYRGLLEAAPDAMVVVNAAGEIVLLNVQAEKQFGYRRDELVGQQVTNIIPEGFAERITADGARSAADALAQQIGTGIELTARRKDGNRFPIEIMLSPLKSPSGILVTAAIRDITYRKQAESNLRSLAERLSLANAVANVGVWDFDPASNAFTWDVTMCEIYGFAPGDPIPYAKWSAAICPDDRAPTEAILQRVVCEKNLGPVVEFRITRADGALRNVSAVGKAVLDERGNVTRVIGVNIDITGRKRAQAQFLESEERFRTLVEGVRDYAIFTLDPAGKVVSWNAGAERIKGYKAEEIIGQNFSRFYLQTDIDQGKPEKELLVAATSGRSEIEHWRVRKDGSQFWANVVITAARDSSGCLLGFSEISRDISERKDREAKYRGLLEAAPDAMVVVNAAGEIVLLNFQAEKQFGYHRDELVGQQVTNIIPKGFAERIIADGTRTAAAALAQQIGTGIELTARRKDGSDFPIEIMLSPLENAEGILVTAAIRDITERKKSEQHLVKTVAELKRSNDELQQFAYVASHDLQEPLRMVASYTQLLAKRYKGRLDSDADEFIAYAVDGSNRMQGLIQDLLAYSRAGTDGKALRKVSSENALQTALTNLCAAIEESSAVVTHDELPTITTDDTQLTQVFQNLIGNAIKYHGTHTPQVHVSASKNGGQEWIFAVRDNGLGIDPQYFDRIFIIFQRLHGQKEFQGTGIGLALCKKMLERLDGRIWVESQAGSGSTFFFALPEREAI
jgi:PAS domain S-box-containing protein